MKNPRLHIYGTLDQLSGPIWEVKRLSYERLTSANRTSQSSHHSLAFVNEVLVNTLNKTAMAAAAKHMLIAIRTGSRLSSVGDPKTGTAGGAALAPLPPGTWLD
jgi:hypothetical protein